MKNNHKISFLFILFSLFLGFWEGWGGASFAQNKNIDSLLILLKKDKPDTNKVNHLCQLTNEFQSTGDFERGLTNGTMALELAHKLNFKKGIASASYNIGTIYYRQADYPNALVYYLKVLKLQEELKNKKGIAEILSIIAIVYVNQDDYLKALDHDFRALRLNEELKNKKGEQIDDVCVFGVKI